MTRALLFVHEGVPCAFPASQVRSAGGVRDEVPGIRLFERRQLAAPPHGETLRVVWVDTPAGVRRLDCSEARVGSLGDRLHPLPELLRGCLGLPHVVGIAETDEGLRWLVDLEAWEDT